MSENIQAVMTSVNKILNDTDLNKMVEPICERLVSFGYIPTEEDAWMIAFTMQKTTNHILNQINRSTIPDGLFEVAVDMVCGEVLNAKFLCGRLELTSLDFSGAIQSVSEGDTTVTFGADGSDESKARELFAWLMGGKGCDLLCYRRIKW
jgi:hypothetical protein